MLSKVKVKVKEALLIVIILMFWVIKFNFLMHIYFSKGVIEKIMTDKTLQVLLTQC